MNTTRPLVMRTLARPASRRKLPRTPSTSAAAAAERGARRERLPERRDAADDVAERMLKALTW